MEYLVSYLILKVASCANQSNKEKPIVALTEEQLLYQLHEPFPLKAPPPPKKVKQSDEDRILPLELKPQHSAVCMTRGHPERGRFLCAARVTRKTLHFLFPSFLLSHNCCLTELR